MSAFIVSDKTLHRAVTAMNMHNDVGDLDALGQQMLNLNYEAVRYRYGDRETPPKYHYEVAKDNNCQLLKSLRCLIYQCSQGSIPEKSLLYREMNERAVALANKIVAQLPDYDKAEWD